MILRKVMFLALLLILQQSLSASEIVLPQKYHGVKIGNDSLFAYNNPAMQIKRPWRAAFETFLINAGVHAFDRFVLNEEFAKVRLKDIGRNITHAPVWDNDQFSTNLFAHPYHGGLYYSTARSSGMTLYESLPYAFAGSLMWEYMGEVEPPAINDLFATTIGSVAMGEVTYRISNLILNDATRGFSRFFRELIAGVFNPVRGVNRLISGDAWHVRNKYYLYHDKSRIPVSMTVTTGDKYLSDHGTFQHGKHSAFVDFDLNYGDVFDNDDSHPYDYFSGNLTVNTSSPLISDLHVVARMWGTEMNVGKAQGEFGIFHHFNYYDSGEIVKDGDEVPFRISETASIGPGIAVRHNPKGRLKRMEHRLFVDLILLGGVQTDYYRFIDRDYNMGSGFSLKYFNDTEIGNSCRFRLKTDFYRLFTWKGYEQKDYENINPLYLNSQGDKSIASILILNPIIDIKLAGNLYLQPSIKYVLRKTAYKFHDDKRKDSFETRLGFSYRL